jgi:RNA polymerase sigma-70 factor, ECF subfamily
MNATLAPTPAALAAAEDAVLAQRAQQGDPAAFTLLMRRHNRRLFRLARSLLRNAAEAEDALQEAYLCAYRALGSFRGESSLATWLSRVVANECTARLRKQARRDNIVPMVSVQDLPDAEEMPMTPPTSEPDPGTPERALARTELRELLERRIDALPESFRTVFILRCVEELSVEETAACLQIPDATVRSRLFRARSLLRESLAQDIDMAERDVFSFDGERCDRLVAKVQARIAAGD